MLFWVPGSDERLFRLWHDSETYKITGEYETRVFESTDYLKDFWNSEETQQTLSFWQIADAVLDPDD
jgi:hypothetical protein